MRSEGVLSLLTGVERFLVDCCKKSSGSAMEGTLYFGDEI